MGSQVSGVVRFQNKLHNVVQAAARDGSAEMDAETTKILHKTMKKVTEDIESMSFNTAISAMMVSPFAPHIGEECWSLLGHDGTLAYHPWVEHDEALCIDNTVTMGVQVNGKRRGAIEIAKDADQEAAMAEAMKVQSVCKQVDGKDVKKIIYVPGRILNIVAK